MSDTTPGSARLRRLLAAQMINDAGTGITTIVIPLLVYNQTKSAIATSLVVAADALPTLIFGLLGGVIADSMPRHRIVVLCAAGMASSMALIPAGYDQLGLPAVLGLSFVANSFQAIAGPALRSMMPTYFGDDYQKYSGWRSFGDFATTAIGPALGGALVGFVGAANAIYVDAFSYLIFGLLILSLQDLRQLDKNREVSKPTQARLDALREGFAHARHNGAARRLLSYWFLSLTAIPLALIAAIPFVTTELGQSEFKYGVAVSCYAVAALASSIAATRIEFRGSPRRWLLASGMGYATVNLVMVLEPSYLAFAALWLLWGLAYGPESVVGDVVFARAVPPSFQGRLYSLMSLVIASANLLGAIIAGPLIETLGATNTMFIAGVVFAVATLSSFATPGSRKDLDSILLTSANSNRDSTTQSERAAPSQG